MGFLLINFVCGFIMGMGFRLCSIRESRILNAMSSLVRLNTCIGELDFLSE
jgi:uncharacterized membrane protein YqgA involved in biofilm formation